MLWIDEAKLHYNHENVNTNHVYYIGITVIWNKIPQFAIVYYVAFYS